MQTPGFIIIRYAMSWTPFVMFNCKKFSSYWYATGDGLILVKILKTRVLKTHGWNSYVLKKNHSNCLPENPGKKFWSTHQKKIFLDGYSTPPVNLLKIFSFKNSVYYPWSNDLIFSNMWKILLAIWPEIKSEFWKN